jgi:hypothetical protein
MSSAAPGRLSPHERIRTWAARAAATAHGRPRRARHRRRRRLDRLPRRRRRGRGRGHADPWRARARPPGLHLPDLVDDQADRRRRCPGAGRGMPPPARGPRRRAAARAGRQARARRPAGADRRGDRPGRSADHGRGRADIPARARHGLLGAVAAAAARGDERARPGRRPPGTPSAARARRVDAPGLHVAPALPARSAVAVQHRRRRARGPDRPGVRSTTRRVPSGAKCSSRWG